MGLFDSLFSKKQAAGTALSAFRFGRYSDNNKTDAQLRHWDDAQKSFTQKNYLGAYRSFFNYLKDDSVGNVQVQEANGKLNFTILQGSKTTNGYATADALYAETPIATYEKLPVPVMRKLMELNYTNRYGSFSIHDNVLMIKFDTPSATSMPEKLYFALKELAVRADKQDDLLLDEFNSLKAINTAHLQPMGDGERKLKCKHFKLLLNARLQRARQLSEMQGYEGGCAYVLLNLLYKLDYLLAPEGKLMHQLEVINNIYWRDDKRPVPEKNKDIIDELAKLTTWTDEQIEACFMRTVHTFGIANPSTFKAVQNLITEQVSRHKWYADNGHADIALDVLEYVATYSLFNYGLKKVHVNLLHFVVQLCNPQFFAEMGLPNYSDASALQLSTTEAQKELSRLLAETKTQLPLMQFIVTNVKTDTLLNFLFGYLSELSYQAI